MKARVVFACLVCVCLLPVACHSRKSSRLFTEREGISNPIQYAEGFSITHTNDYTQITVFNPWKGGEVYDSYYLVKDEKTVVPSDGHKVIIPLKSLMVNSATHLGFLDLLGETDKVTGVFSASFIYHPSVSKGVEEGRLMDLGDSFHLDMERLLLLKLMCG
ncbi:hypothetical protein EZS27_012815 [termite gut metagenome]|uniref:Uncharacterized protein n=2 Tax=termite gut metagenome TaxID=433724 RepID=A0A5J4S1T2_9ZZZZ